MLQVTIEDISHKDDSSVEIEVENQKLISSYFSKKHFTEQRDIDSGRTMLLSLTLVRQIVEAFNGNLHITHHGGQKASTVCFTMNLKLSMMSPNISAFDPKGF